MAEQRWFYEMLAEEFGPVTVTAIEQLVADGMLSATDRVRPSESGEWITVAEFPTAVNAASLEQPDDRHSELDIDSFSFESSPDAPEDELDIDSFNLIGDSDSPQPVVTNPHKATEPADDEDEEDFEPTFFVQSLGQVLGPLTQEELVEMACAGSLSRGDEIREGEDSRWIAVEAIPGLGAEILRQEATLPQAKTTSPKPAEKKKSGTRKRPSASNPKSKSKRRKRKKKAKTDDFLQEIFAEVFTDDGKVREDRIAAAAAAAAPPSPVPNPAAMSGDAGSQVPAMNAAAPGMSAAASSPAAFTKPVARRPAKAAKASRSSPGFEMPEPKVLGIIGGGLAVILIIVGGYMGVLPGFGVDPESFFREFAAEYPKMKAGSAEEWKVFKSEQSVTARGIARGLAPSVATDPEAKRFQRVALLVTKIVNISQTDAEKHTEAFTEFNKMLAGTPPSAEAK